MNSQASSSSAYDKVDFQSGGHCIFQCSKLSFCLSCRMCSRDHLNKRSCTVHRRLFLVSHKYCQPSIHYHTVSLHSQNLIFLPHRSITWLWWHLWFEYSDLFYRWYYQYSSRHILGEIYLNWIDYLWFLDYNELHTCQRSIHWGIHRDLLVI